MKKEFVIAVMCLVMAFGLFGFMLADAQKDTDLYENMVNASVIVYDERGGGSGVFIYDNVVLTAAHVLENVNTVSIELNDGTVLKSNDFYMDDKEDVGFVFVEADELCITKVSLSSVSIGDTVYLVGAPFNKFFAFTMTKGIISHIDRDVPEWNWNDLLQTDAEGGPGSSGGPLYDSKGDLVGIYVGHAGDGGIGISLCESSKSILEAYERCMNAR